MSTIDINISANIRKFFNFARLKIADYLNSFNLELIGQTLKNGRMKRNNRFLHKRKRSEMQWLNA